MKILKRNRHLLLSTVLVTLFLGYIDEGYYNFQWMKNPGNWFALGIYGIGIYGCQWMLLHVVFKKVKEHWKNGASIVLGSALGILAVAAFFITWRSMLH